MQLSFIMVPTISGTRQTVAHWREAGLEELWRPDGHTVLLGSADKAQVMVEDNSAEWDLGRGPVFVVDEVAALEAPVHGWSIEPTTVTVGGYAAGVVHGCPVRYMDLTRCPGDKRELFG